MEEVIRKYFQCWLDKDVDAVKGIFSEDVVYSECYGPVYKGIGQIIRWFEDWNQKGTVLQWDIKRVIVSGNTAVVAHWGQALENCNRGLEKDYDNYLHRDDMEYRLARKRQEMKEMEQARLQKKTRSNREDR